MSASLPSATLLESRWADALSVILFATAGVALSALPLPSSLSLLGPVIALLGPLSCAIEGGEARLSSWPWCLLWGSLAAAAHAGLSLWWLPAQPWPWLAPTPALPADLLWQSPLIFCAGCLLPRLGRRLERGEAGWRAALRQGQLQSTPPVALRLASARIPRLLAWSAALLIPLEWLLRGFALSSIFLYQLTLSRLMPPSCRYEPTCSRYGFLALARHGSLRGGLLTALRLLRCSPLGAGGFDPVPESSPAARKGTGAGYGEASSPQANE